ncbi:protein of unknown function DUF1538 [Thioalkalivibrio nitratireducens DSM 14787]|uniref:DUF1538 domain-containing protein n=1 Tax=Thioalkalivibrio nitratireducens (strain DSM 14787 / UNIQEM 213 / ALEN2) TaxID=1255043 RepID=L0DWZ3_THIND|nr:DUF1538 domain-containing protein [Thioalkalivibrio nitratireducens]AGA33527.1 protein of unknown function DUF1538 [Thioalkalivibrio nitratireducens DSM 14787]
MGEFGELARGVLKSGRNLLPVIAVVALFQAVVLREIPEGVLPVIAGLALVAVGIGLFLRGLELSVFPVGRSLANAFAEKGSLPWLLAFGFCLGFAAVIAEPALIAVAHKAQTVSDGLIQAWTLRIVVAGSVGAVVALGILRAVLNHPVHWYLIGGYLLLVPVTYLTPPEVTGLAYDAGAVSANIVTVPLVAALGIGLMASLRGRSVLADGFGLVALAVFAPRVAVQIYGIVVYAFEPGALAGYTGAATAPLPADDGRAGHAALVLLATDLLRILGNLLPIVAVVLAFQLLVIRRPLLHPHRLAGGFLFLVAGLFAFTEGLHLGLFPIGEHLAAGLAGAGSAVFLYLFVFLLGFAATLVEPALIAVAQRAGTLAPRRLHPPLIRGLVALGVGLGLGVGTVRLVTGWPLDHVLVFTVLGLMLLTLLAPRDLVGFSFDLGGIATSDVTVPVIAALGVGLAVALESDDVLLDGFGLVALASLYPIGVVLLYSIFTRAAPSERH